MAPWFTLLSICASAIIITSKTAVTQVHNETVNDGMEIHDLLVTEGGHSVITSANINVNISHEEFEASESLVLFRIVKSAQHGKLIVSGEHTLQSPVMDFTAADLISNRIVYVHDSSEDSLDSVAMDVHIVRVSALNVTKRLNHINLAIKVLPRNDVPELLLPNSRIQVIANTRLRITGTLLNASDVDNEPSDLLYYVHYQTGFDGGYFEVSDSIKVRSKVMYFTQLDVNSGKVYYVSRDRSFQQVSLQVSDGTDVSNLQTLNIEAIELKVSTLVNQALVLPYYSSGLITTDNLHFSTNAQFQDIELRFEITHFARWGSIQRRRYADNMWVDTSTFAQQNLYEHRLRYLHNTTSPAVTEDSFCYQVTALGLQVKDAEFSIKFVEMKVELVKNSGLHLQGVTEGVITTDVLQAKCSIPLNPDHIVYRITSLPSKGHLISKNLVKQKPHYSRNILSLGQNFSQTDINAQVITYKMTKTPHSPDTDDFEFEIIASGFKLKACLFRFSFEPSKNGLHIVNSGLTGVVEGQSMPITSLELFAEGPLHANTTYLVTDGPYHGVLQLLLGSTGLVELNSSHSFNTDDILNHRVHYYHDDSENDADFFSFKSVSIFNQLESKHINVIELYGIFDIRITMKNDNPPTKRASVMSCALFNEGSIITPHDLRFVDPDMNFDNSLLQYDWLKNNSREIVLASNHEIKVNRFTQKDIDSGRLYLKNHCSGNDTYSSAFTVTDGHFRVRDLFEVRVLDPFVRLQNLTHLLIRETKKILVFPRYFRIETNAETNDSNIFISIINQTSCGVFKKLNDIRTWFTLADLKNLVISYEFDSTNISCNNCKFMVTVNGLNSQGWIRIEYITDDSHLNFMKAYNNKASVEEFGVLTLTSQFLYFQNSLVNAYEVHYTITSPPSNGKLWLTGKQNTSELYAFTQTEIDNGYLHYEHQLYGQKTDVFHFDIQCDSFFITGLNFFIDVIPQKIPLTVKNLTVREGSVTFVTQHSLSIENRFFHVDDIEFQIVSWPKYGNIRNKDLSETRISQFSADQVLMLKILYASDGSDVTSDTFEIFARSRLHNKWSDVMTVHVSILPVNDQPPILVINKKLKVFSGSSMPITRNHLYAIDNDTQPDDIVFYITEVVNSELTKIDYSFEKVWNFTQADIDNKKITVHIDDGKETAFFRFRVTDHVNTSQVTMFEMESILLILTLESCQTLNLFPGQTQPITSFHLKSKTNYTNFPDHSLLYKIIKRPSKGYLVLSSNGQHNEIDEFTQEDLNAKMVLYNHSSQMDGWTQYDFFVFQVHSNFTLNLLLETFNVSISYSNIDLNDSIWNFTCQHAVVSEGGKVVITRSELDASVMEYQLSSYGLEEVVVRLIVQEIPRHGFMTLGVVNMTRGSKIVQQNIDQGLLIYSHDDSESYSDEFSFTVEIVAKVKTRSSKPELHQLPHLLRVFPFTVEPINDQHFSLLTPVPAIELVQGSNYLITDEVLLTIDPDTPSENITYEIASPPTNGFLICLNEAGPEQVMSFTQKDINEKRIQFVHDGSSDSGAFYFRVSDGIHRPLYKVFNILIMPLVVDIMLTPIEILQGQNQTILSQHQFKVKTNGRKEVLMYNITRPPKYGSLFKNNTVTCHFSQMEVEAGQIYYLQDDLSTFADEFEFLLYDIKNTIHGKTDINVLPNIKNIDGRPLSAVINNASEISLSHLDAGELAKMTSSDPVYHVTHCPAHGVLVRLSILNVQMEDWSNKGKGQTSTGRKLKLGQNYVDSFFQFTHSDIANRRIKYLPNHNITSMELTDSFGYIVIARSVQPARGIFHIKVFQTEAHTQRDLRELVDEQEISAANVSTIFPKTYLVPLSAMEVEEVKSFDKSFIIILALLAILIIIVIAIIAIRCVKRNRQANAQIKEASIVSLVPSAAFPLAVPSSTKDNQESQHNLSIIQEEPVLETCTVTLQGQGPDVVDLTLVTHPQESQSLSAVHSPTNISSKGLDEKLLLYFERLTAV